ncbi:MAG: PSD1 and planctomycete cytochrome C domain-containing protein [Verrucomicrobia bacterium]|nr:PSD1 and planctomycete cytochrome C domain-containing protein [Verrucomicrobiota bacterium]
MLRLLLTPLITLTCLQAQAAVDFQTQILPVLKRACFECHGPDVQKAGLRLDHKAGAFAGGEHGAVLVAGQAQSSELLRRVSLPRTDKDAMPRRGKPLTTEEVALLKAWITEGASWPETTNAALHWSYQKPVQAPLPEVRQSDWARNEIDSFILAKLEKEKLLPAKQADTAALVRRLYLAIIGLPPPVEEVIRLEKLGYPLPQKEIEALVDRLLKNEEFGVRWARPWLDLARYADSHGFQRDDLREIWGFRDWVVTALNADMPFDQFTIDQVAGDLLPKPTPEQIVATGFHRCTPTNVEAGTEPEESRINQVLDRVNTTGAVWLGSTLECAQCHNHKYDPFSQEDYYRLMAYFNNTEKEAERANPKVPGSIAFNGIPFAMSSASSKATQQMFLDQKNDLEKRNSELKKDADAQYKIWLKQISSPAQQLPVTEHALEVVEFISEGGASHRELEDGSILLSGEAPATDTYRVVLKGSQIQAVTGIKLEALTDASLPGQGPGRTDPKRPNFVLNSFQAATRLADANDDATKPLSFIRATADFSQKNFDPSGAIDEDEKTGWAINPQFDKPHWAIFELDAALNLTAETELVITLKQNFGGGRTMGRLRLTALTGDLNSQALPEAIATVVKKKPTERSREERLALRAHFDAEMPALKAIKQELTAMNKKIAGIKAPTTEVMKELPQARQSAIFKRGVYTEPGAPVTAGTPAILPKDGGMQNRLGLAQWLISKDNPLTARVTVNRWWSELFGHGLVTTLEDFGIKGEAPTHPELLDWLAVQFMKKGWSMKQMIRIMATSATFCQDATISPAMLERDDANLLYARGPRFRLDAEGVRDNALAIAGLLSSAKGGPPIYPPQPDGLWKKVGGQQYDYTTSSGEKKYRRGLYIVLKRGAPYPSLVNFDASARMACVVKRSRSNTPLQALTLLNDPVYVEAAQAFGARIQKEQAGASLDDQLTHAYRLALSRAPTGAELTILRDLMATEMSQGHDPTKAWFAIAAALLNLDECITKG